MSFYLANDKYAATLSSGYTVGQTTLSVNVVPDNVPTLVVVAKGTTKETVFIVTGKTINSLTGVSRLKGYNVDLDANMPVTCLNNSEFVNQYSAAVSTPESLIQLLYGVDGGSTDAYAVSLDVAPTAYTAGMMIAFKANTVNTGACTLNVNSLGAKAIKIDGTATPANGDIQAGQVVIVIYDGTNFQLQTDIPVLVEVTPTSTNTLTNKRIEPRVVTAASYTTDTGTSLSVATADIFQVTAQAGALKLNNPSGTPVAGQKLIVRIKDNGTARALTYDTEFRASTDLALPTTTVLSKTLYMGFIFNATDTKWDLVAYLDNI